MSIQAFTLTDEDSGEQLAFEIFNVESVVDEQWAMNDSHLTVSYKVPWPKRYLARKLLLGSARRTVYTPPGDGAGTPYLRRTLPHRWIEFDTSPNLYCTRISRTRGLETKAEPACYVWAQLTAVYSHLPYDIASDATTAVFNPVVPGAYPDESAYVNVGLVTGNFVRFVERNPPHSDGRIIQTFGAGGVYAEENGTPIFNRPVLNGQPFPYFEETIAFTWHQIPEIAVPWTLISQSLNKINDAAFVNYAAKTVMFLGCEPTFIRMPDGVRGWNLKYKFKYNRYGWDRLPDPTDGLNWRRFVVLRRGQQPKEPFDSMDFGKFFRPA